MPKHASSSSAVSGAEAPAKKKRKKTQTVAALKKQLAQCDEKELIEIIAALVQSKKVTNVDKIAACANVVKRFTTIARIVRENQGRERRLILLESRSEQGKSCHYGADRADIVL